MEIIPLRLTGSHCIKLAPIRDERGYFVRTLDTQIFKEHGLQTQWVQENQSSTTKKHTIRGFHFQLPSHSETKLVRVVQGAVLDVFIDLRMDSPTYGQWDSLELSTDNFLAVYVPRGFAHAFCSLTDSAVVTYKVDSHYAPASESSIRWDDPTVGVEWPTPHPHLSDKDKNAPSFVEFKSPFTISQ